MKRRLDVRSVGVPSAAIRRRLVTSIQPQSACGRRLDLVVAGQPALPHPCGGGVAPGVVVEMKAKAGCGRRRDVAPREQLVALQRPARRIETDVDGVAGISWRARLRRGDGRRGRRCLGFGVQSAAADRHDCSEGNGRRHRQIALHRARTRPMLHQSSSEAPRQTVERLSASLVSRPRSPVTFGRRCIPGRGVARRLHTPGMRSRLARRAHRRPRCNGLRGRDTRRQA